MWGWLWERGYKQSCPNNATKLKQYLFAGTCRFLASEADCVHSDSENIRLEILEWVLRISVCDRNILIVSSKSLAPCCVPAGTSDNIRIVLDIFLHSTEKMGTQLQRDNFISICLGLISMVLHWGHRSSFDSTCTHLESMGLTWSHLVSIGITGIHLYALDFSSSSSLLFHFDFASMSRRRHSERMLFSPRFNFVFSSTSLRYNFEFASMSLGFLLEVTSAYFWPHFEFTLMSIRSHFVFTSLSHKHIIK